MSEQISKASWRWYKDTEDRHAEGEYSDLQSPSGTVLSYSTITAQPKAEFSTCIEVSEADARLIAAAPELLEALQAFAVALKEPDGGEYWSARAILDRLGIFHDDLSGTRVLLRVAEAVIAKATEPEVTK